MTQVLEPAGTLNLLEPLLAVVWQDLELWTTREPCRSLGFLKRDSSTSLLQKKKKKEFGLIRQVKSYIDIQVKGAENNLFMVDLISKIHTKFEKNEKTMFLIDTTYSCLVQMEEEKDEDAKKRTVLISVPTLIFPSVRALVTRLTSESGFPPLALQPVDFAALYEQKNAK